MNVSSTVTTIGTPYSSAAPKGGPGSSTVTKSKSSSSQVKSRPSLRRPKVANVAAAEAEVAAAKAGSSKASDSTAAPLPPPAAKREEAEGAETSGPSASTPSEFRDTGGEQAGGPSVKAGGVISEDYSKLRCSSVTTEELAEREKAKSQARQRQNRCPDYPGLAFGAAMGFGSDTMMKFNIIKNELHNIMRSQLKRVDGEVVALSERIKLFDENLEKSEHYIKIATSTLAEAVQLELERKEREGDDDSDDELSQFDAQMALLEGKLLQAKALAQESSSMASTSSSLSALPPPVPVEHSSERILAAD